MTMGQFQVLAPPPPIPAARHVHILPPAPGQTRPVTNWAQLPLFSMWLMLLYHLVVVHGLWHAPIYASRTLSQDNPRHGHATS